MRNISIPSNTSAASVVDAVFLSTPDMVTLSNGARVILNPMPEAPRLALNVYLPGGNRLDPVPGIADMIDRLLPKGSSQRNAEKMAIALDSLSLDIDTDTRRDYSAVNSTVLPEDLDEALPLIREFMLDASFNELEREKERLAGEIRMDLDSPRSRSSDQFVRTLFKDTPYNAVSSVLLDNIERFGNQESLLKHYHRIYQPERFVFSVSGPFQKDALLQKLEATFVSVKPDMPVIEEDPAVEANIRNLETTEPTLVTFPRDDSTQAHVFKGWLVPEATHEDYYALTMLNTILGAAGLSSRLFVNMRDRQGLAYHVRSSMETFRYTGMFTLYIGTEPKNIQKCLDGFRHECQDLMDNLVSDIELAEAKRNMLGKRSVMLEPAAQQAAYLGTNLMLGRNLESVTEVAQKLQAVTAQDIQRVAQLYFNRPAVVSVVAPSSAMSGISI